MVRGGFSKISWIGFRVSGRTSLIHSYSW